MNSWDIFLLFGFIGIFGEVVFTGVMGIFRKKDFTLEGTSYLWMFPIYGAAGVMIQFLHAIFFGYNFFFRGAIYSAYILFGEFVTGMFLKFYIGKCPWNYTSRFSWCNVVRLDYFPLWMVVGLMIEKLIVVIN